MVIYSYVCAPVRFLYYYYYYYYYVGFVAILKLMLFITLKLLPTFS